MAKKTSKHNGNVNKSQAIRDALAKDPAASPKQLSADLMSQGIDASPAYVSMIKSAMKLKVRKTRRGMASAKSGGDVVASDLVETKKLVDKVGGIEKAESLLGTLKKLL